ncbi:MAG: bifunctional uridylyltransferase/uridylyl-removing enzyme [Candidatus Hydrogenedentota bacterium]
MSQAFLELVETAKDASRPVKLDRTNCVQATRQFAASRWQEVQARHNAGESGANVVRLLSDAADEIVRGVLHLALTNVPQGRSLLGHIALCALGGYGRGELSPHSDLDVCLVYEGKLDDRLKDLNQQLITLLWDSGFSVGYTIHKISEARDLAKEDLTIFTRFLQSRLIAGDNTVFARLKLTINELRTRAFTEYFLERKVRERYDGLEEAYTDLYAPEPHIKESAGGLRDAHTALWLLMMAYDVHTFDDVISQGLITAEEHLKFMEGTDFIWRIRNSLHFQLGREEDRLTYANQRHMAVAMGYDDTQGIPKFMSDYYGAARQLRHMLGIAARICNFTPITVVRDATSAPPKDIYVSNGELFAGVHDENWFVHNPVRLMEIFWRCARDVVRLSRHTEKLVKQNLHLVTESFQSSYVVHRYFNAICNRPLQAGFAMRQMATVGFLGQYIPEFRAIKDIIRYKDFHHYPVDEHTLRALESLEKLPSMEGAVGRCLREALENLTDPYILVLAILFHDVGKAEGEVHTDESVVRVHQFARRVGLSEDDEERVAFLVQHHSLMTFISQYRDIDDEDIVQNFVNVIKTEQRLRALFVLSYADLSAVGPGVWTEWKGALLLQLYLRSSKRLLGRVETAEEDFWNSPKATAVVEAVDPSLRSEVELHLRALGPRYFVAFQPAQIAEHIRCTIQAKSQGLALRSTENTTTGLSEVVVCTRDRQGLFAQLAGCFASQLMDINSAALFTRDDGWVVDCFTLADARTRKPLTKLQIGQLERVLHDVLIDNNDVQAHVDKSRKRLFALLQPRVPVPTRVEFDNHSSKMHTVIDIETGDRTGLLYDITRAMFNEGLDIAQARIVTDARRIRDSFYVTLNGEKVEEEESLAAIQEGLHNAIHPRAAVETKGEVE